jgi:peptidoglycan/LPS O-acetylase OafA/YrhL
MSRSPYRVHVGRPEQPPLPAPAVIARRAATASSVPRIAIALAFFLPAMRVCDAVQSPLEACTDGWAVAWIAPPFAMALLLGLFTWVAHARRRPPPPLLVAPVALGLLLYAVAIPLVALAGDSDPQLDVVVVAWGAAMLACVVRGLRRRGWARWAWLGHAHVVMGAALAALFAGVAIGEPDSAHVGAYAYLLAYAGLLGVLLWSLRAASIRRWRRRRASSQISERHEP